MVRQGAARPAVLRAGHQHRGVHLADGSWQREVTRSVLQFRGMRTVEEYVAKTCEIVVANAAQYAPTVVQEALAAEPSRGAYVDVDLMAELETAAATTGWKVHKLIALCQDLNDAYAAGNPYACAAMIRTILDHIPPVFGHTNFKYVAAQHVFSMKRNDKMQAQKLAAFKDIADDVMHRPIGRTVPRISMDDLPEPIRLNAVLNEVVVMLPKTAPST